MEEFQMLRAWHRNSPKGKVSELPLPTRTQGPGELRRGERLGKDARAAERPCRQPEFLSALSGATGSFLSAALHYCTKHTMTESQNGRGWKGPL